MKRKNIFLLAFIAAILIIVVMFISSTNNNVSSNNLDGSLDLVSSYGVSRNLDGDHVLSNGSPSNTIIEYASMTCPHCADFHNEVFPYIKSDLVSTGKVKYIFI